MELYEARILARAEMEKWGLIAKGWTFGFNHRKKTLGICYHYNKKIELSNYYVVNNSGEYIIDTIRHEIAHALAGPTAGHKRHWKYMCRMVGCTDRRASKAVQMPQGRYVITCPTCNHSWYYHRKSRIVREYGNCWCTECGKNTKGQLVLQENY